MMLNKLSLNTIGLNRIGLNRIGKPSRGSLDRPYIDPEVLASLKTVCICYGKSNDDSDRAIIKNLVDPDNPFIISNAAYKLNSGFGLYQLDFDSLDRTDQSELTTDYKSVTISKIIKESDGNVIYNWSKNLPALDSVRIQVKGLDEIGARLVFIYLNDSGQNVRTTYHSDGIYTLPSSSAHAGNSYTTNFRLAIFGYTGDCNVTITQIPQYEGAFVTDGIDDLITSTKTVQEMLGGSTEFTAVSMIHLTSVGQSVDGNAYTNYIRTSDNYWVSNRVSNTDKTGIYGYSFKQGTPTVINNILGDKNDYTAEKSDDVSEIFRAKFSVEGFEHITSGAVHVSSVAWYWTVIANKVLTTDQINQVIAYYNLDRCVEPTVWYDVQKQGLSNETPAADWYLKDFSKNGFDMSLFNFAKKGNSGVGKYEVDFTSWKKSHFTDEVNTSSSKIEITGTLTTNSILINTSSTPIYNVEIYTPNKSLTVYFQYNDGTRTKRVPLVEGINELPSANDSIFVTSDLLNSEGITITQIPSHAGALCLDGVNDYGQFVGNLGLKDYTVAINRAYQSLINNQVPLVSSNLTTDNTPFLMEHWNTDTNAISFSFGASKITNVPLDISKKITYQSTYSYMGDAINKGTSTSIGDGLTLGKYGAGVQYASIVLWNLLLFPYSLSPFLLERQLKKYKVGTLYPDMVEWRPKVKSDDRIKSINFYINLVGATVGNYYPIGAGLGIAVEPVAPYYVNSLKVNGKATIPNADHKGFNGTLDAKSPQNITMDIVVDGSLVQWNPTYNSNVAYQSVTCLNYSDSLKTVNVGDYVKVGDALAVRVILANTLDEVANTKVNGQECEIVVVSPRVFDCKFFVTSDSPQKVDITIDEYVRFEDLVQPYPVFVGLGSITWGSKLKVGSTISFIGMTNLLSEYYSINGELLFNGVPFNRNSGQHVIEKTNAFSFSQPFTYIGDGNEPKCILYPERLSIPNGSYQILGYIPDISGHGNNGRFNNFAFTSESGANEDGSIHFDGVTDFIDVPNTVGGKQMIMKVQWDEPTADAIIYDQRGYPNEFAIYNADTYNDGTACVAYQARNSGRTFIDGILNSNIKASELKTIKHIITSTNELSSGANNKAPHIGSNAVHDSYFTKMALYDFMLFDEISTDEEILTLNEYVGIEGNTDDLFTENN